MNKNILIILVSLLFNFGYAQTNTWTGAINTAWENDLNWSLGVAPQALEDVVIPPVVNQPVISTAGVTCTALTLGAGSSLTISASGTLAVIGEITITAPTFDNGNTTLAVGSGTLAAGGITMEAGVNDTRKCHLTIDTGTANVVGNVIMTGSVLQNNIAFTSIGSLNIGGTMTGGSLTPGIGEVNYNGPAAQVVGNYVYDNLTLSGAGIKTFDSAIAVNNTLSIEAGVVADLGTFIHSTFLLSLNGSNSTGTWGGVGSAAINISPTFFAANSGIVNVGPPTVQATNVVFTNTTSTSTNVSWTNGNGASRIVFVRAGSSGNPVPLNYFAYTANSFFGSGTEIGSSGWFCVYKGIGTTVDLTGLSPSTTYQVMTLEYNGSLGHELHLTATSTGNPAEISTITLGANTIGPGGVLMGLNMWLDASNGVTSSGNNLTGWSDITAINTFTVSATPPTVTTNAINFHPTVNFNNSDAVATYPATQNLTGSSNITYVDAYAVFKVNNSNGGTVIGSTVAGNSYGRAVFSQSGGRMYTGNGNASTFSFFPYTDVANFHLFSMEKNSNLTIIGRLDGNNQVMNDQGNFSSINFIPTVGTTNNNGVGSGWRHLTGNIAEVIIYNQSAATQKINIESYLALKYGIHKADNYVNSANTVIWDATANVAYHNDVFGFGQDDLSGLNQSISNSMNTGSGDGTGQSAKGNIIISNPSSLVNNSFLMIGHNVAALTETIVPVGSDFAKRIQRIWKVQTTSTPGTVTLSYDITGLTYSAQNTSDYKLLVDPTGTGNFNGGSVVQYTAVSLVANKVSFNTVDLPTGAVFTFQTLLNPTVQATNVVFTATTGTTTTASWTNGNGSSRAVFMYVGSNGSPVPVNNTTYTASTTFGTGTQIGTTGWYCIYNGTGSTVNITGVTPATTYQVMTLEYNGAAGNEMYQTAVSTGNPASVTTLNNIATLSNLTISEGTLDPVFDTGTTSYVATVPNAVTSLTVTPTTTDTNATVTVNGLTVTGGSASDPISLTVGPNVITTIVTAQDGTTIETYTITVTRAPAPPIITSFSPETGPIETTVIINGENFGATIAENTVYFGAVKATIASASATSLTVTVPVGATYFPITVLNNTTVLSANSLVPFILDFAPNKGNITTDDFMPRINFAEIGSVEELVVGDFDGDGKPDLALTLPHLDQLTFLRNTAVSGTIDATSFTAAGIYTLDDYPVGISVADIDGDGKLDIVAANYHVSTISILRNTSSGVGNISFAPQILYNSGLDPYRLAIGDIDGDGKLDIATANKTGNSVSVFRNLSPGIGVISFDNRIDYAVGNSPYGIVIGDIDRDNKIDIITASANTTNPISVLRNISTDGAINFESQVNFSTSFSAYDVAIGDLNKDGKDDLAVANANGNFVSILTNTSSGIGNINFASQVDFPTNGIINNVAFSDLDGDGNLDLAVCVNANDLSVFRNTSTAGGAISFANRVDFVNQLNANSVVVGDFDGDGLNDMATANYESNNNISVFRNNPLFAPTVQATNVTFTNTTGTTTTISWTNGNGSSRAVFMYAGASGSTPLPLNFTTYTANAAFATGAQVGTSGWYCVYNGTDATAIVTALTPVTEYQVMVVEYNGSIPGNEMYQTATSTGNPAAVTAPNNIATLSNLSISEGTLDPVFDTATTSYIATVPNAVTSLTVTPTTTDTNATVTVNGLTVAGGSASDPISLTVGPNVITTIVTAQDGTTIETYTITVTRTEPTIVTTGTLSALTTIYGTPSVSGTFNVSGSDMAEGILITAPTGFEVSSDDLTFTNSITVGAAGIIASTPVYIRLKGTVPAGTYSGNIVLTSTNAATVNVATVSSTVTPAALTITADNKTKMYGDDNPTLTLSYSGFVNGDTVGSLTLAPITSTAAVTGSPVGDYTISVSGAANPNYTITYVDGTLTITKALLTITADDQTKVYGEANPTLTATYSGFVNGDTAANLTTAPTITTTALDASPVGTYTITATGAVSDNYDFTYVNGTLTITKALLTITADDQTKVYGSVNPALTASYSGFVNGDTAASLITPPTISTTALDASPVGTYTITASGAVSDNYDFTYVNGNLIITKSLLTITADDKTKVYGEANPTLTASYSGFVNGDTATNLTTSPTITTTALDASPVGTYTITASGAVSDNYDFTYVNGTLTITKAVLTITADDKTKIYGSANPTLTASYSGFVNGDTASSLATPPTISTTALDASPVGTYTITASGAVSDNYDFTYVNGNLTITKALLTITADDQTKVYGTANPALTASYLGFVNGDTASSLATPPTISTTALDASPVGTYTITASGAVSDNYDFTYVNGNLTITKALLTITADDKTKVYGEANPTLTVNYSGFVNGDTAANLITAPTISTTALDASPVGTYSITASGAVSDNYDFTYVNGNLTITKALLTITADDKTKVYGATNPTLTASYLGFVNGDTATNLTTAPTISTTALDASPVGTYAITASGAVSDNYDFTYVNG
ncbi:beta strand repeat-containing protein, partial [Flavobacterium sp. C3NV]|uniref:beta strand repeat-containing protein n=1 Tax=Flavobacterium sp. C3NV TaxID=3393358 RepID=UPI00398F9D9F